MLYHLLIVKLASQLFLHLGISPKPGMKEELYLDLGDSISIPSKYPSVISIP